MPERVHLECKAVLKRGGHAHAFHVDGDRIGPGDLHQPVDGCLRHGNREQSVLEGIARENIGETRRDDRRDTEVGQRPGGMLPARTTAEIIAGDQDIRTGIFGIVEYIAFLGADRFESALAQAFPRYGLQPYGGDNDVGIDIFLPEGDGATFNASDGFHLYSSSP